MGGAQSVTDEDNGIFSYYVLLSIGIKLLCFGP